MEQRHRLIRQARAQGSCIEAEVPMESERPYFILCHSGLSRNCQNFVSSCLKDKVLLASGVLEWKQSDFLLQVLAEP